MPRKLLFVALATLTLLTGCPEKKEEAPQGVDPAANNVVSAASRAKINAELEGVKKACQTFNTLKGTWPADMQELVDSKQWADHDRADPWGNDYVILAEGKDITVITYGADGVEGGEGRDADYSTAN